MQLVRRGLPWILIVGASVAAGRAQAQQPDPPGQPAQIDRKAAIAAARAFLAQARPDLSPEARAAIRFQATLCRALPAEGGRVLELSWRPALRERTGCSLRISPDLQVVSYYDEREGFSVPRFRGGEARPRDEIEAEVERRTRFTRPQLEARARAFLARVYRAFGQRRFRRLSGTRLGDNPILEVFRWEEVPPPGVRAVYPNRIRVDLDPERGQVRTYDVTDVHAPLKQAPALGAAQARARAQALAPGRSVTRLQLWLILRRGRPRPVWLIGLDPEQEPRFLVLDAESGQEVDLSEQTGRAEQAEEQAADEAQDEDE